MFSRITRAALPALLIVLVAIAVTLVFSPEARAAVQALMSFNGVTVSVGDDGKLTATGNTDAIVHQDDYSVAVKSADGCSVQGVAIAPPTTSEFPATADAMAQHPDLVLPNVPAGYELASQTEVVSDGRIVLTWADAAGHTLTYSRNPGAPFTIAVGADAATPCQPSAAGDPGASLPQRIDLDQAGANAEGESVVVEGGAGGAGSVGADAAETHSFTAVAGGDGQPAYAWEAGGYMHLLAASDPALTIDDLKAMQP